MSAGTQEPFFLETPAVYLSTGTLGQETQGRPQSDAEGGPPLVLLPWLFALAAAGMMAVAKRS